MAEPVYTVEMLAAKHGDALFVEYGKESMRRILIDGGPLTAYPALEARLSKLPAGDQAVELLVVTHVDTDHIEGIIRLLAIPVPKWPILVRQIWFNGWRHIEEARNLGGREGEMVSALIHYRINKLWNTAFGGNAVLCGKLPGDEVALADGMKLTLLSPDAAALAELLKDWKAKLKGKKWDLEPGNMKDAWDSLVKDTKFHPGAELTLGSEDLTADLLGILKGMDPSTANGSSIAFIAGYAGRSCLFLGDAHMDVVCGSLKRLGYSKAKPLKASAVKVSHHGSKNNLTPEFIDLVDATHWLFSSNGDKHSHPNEEAVRAVIDGAVSNPTLWFNYRSPFTEKWEAGAQQDGARYRTQYPAKGAEGIVVNL